MKKTLLAISFVLTAACSTWAQAKWPLAPASPPQIISQEFATSKIEISYSRPGVKGRTIFGDVVPYDKVWRTGANAATTITFGEPVTTINGIKIPAGRYGLLTIPGRAEWTIIITKDTSVNNPNNYKQANDLVRISAKPRSIRDTVQNFTIDINNIKPTEAEIFLRWEKTEVGFKIIADYDVKMTQYIDEQLKRGDEKDKPYFNAAVYYYDTNKDQNKALEYINKAIAAKPDAFYMVHQKAKIQYRLGDKKGAIATAEQSLALAKTANNEDYVKHNERLIKEIKSSK